MMLPPSLIFNMLNLQFVTPSCNTEVMWLHARIRPDIRCWSISFTNRQESISLAHLYERPSQLLCIPEEVDGVTSHAGTLHCVLSPETNTATSLHTKTLLAHPSI